MPEPVGTPGLMPRSAHGLGQSTCETVISYAHVKPRLGLRGRKLKNATLSIREYGRSPKRCSNDLVVMALAQFRLVFWGPCRGLRVVGRGS